jgi:predicted metalloprotease with PDZ domain
MSKSNYFSSKYFFGQLISLIVDKKIKKALKNHYLDRYVKRFESKDYFMSMLFCSFAKCNSVREI